MNHCETSGTAPGTAAAVDIPVAVSRLRMWNTNCFQGSSSPEVDLGGSRDIY